jgi:hypothetical protein
LQLAESDFRSFAVRFFILLLEPFQAGVIGEWSIGKTQKWSKVGASRFNNCVK